MAEAKPTGVSISLTVDGTNIVNDAIRRLVAAGTNTRSPMNAITARLLASTKQNFQKEQEPSGEKWQPLSLVTKEIRKAKHKTDIGWDMRILQDTGALIRSIHGETGATHAQVGTGLVYALTHQVGRKIETGQFAGRQIPARPFIGVSEADEKYILGKISAHLAKAIGGGS